MAYKKGSWPGDNKYFRKTVNFQLNTKSENNDNKDLGALITMH